MVFFLDSEILKWYCSFLLQVPESSVADVVQRSITKYFEEWSVVYSNGQISAAKHKVSWLVQSVCHR